MSVCEESVNEIEGPTHENWHQGVLVHADHESGISSVFTIMFEFSILWPVNSTRIEVKKVFPFYYVNISPTGKLYRSKVMEFDNVYIIKSSFFQ